MHTARKEKRNIVNTTCLPVYQILTRRSTGLKLRALRITIEFLSERGISSSVRVSGFPRSKQRREIAASLARSCDTRVRTRVYVRTHTTSLVSKNTRDLRDQPSRPLDLRHDDLFACARAIEQFHGGRRGYHPSECKL